MPVPTVTEVNEFKQDLDDAEALVNGASSVATRLGGTKESYSQLVGKITHGTITTYSAASTYTDIDEWVEESGIVYRPLPSALPIGPETFDANNWIVVQDNGSWRVKTVDDYAALRSESPDNYSVGDTAIVTDDGISRIFKVASGSATDNGDNIITNATWNSAGKHWQALVYNEFNSLSDFLVVTCSAQLAFIKSRYSWTTGAGSPKGSFYVYKTGADAVSPTEGSSVTGYSSTGKIGGIGDGTAIYTGDADQAGYFWTIDGAEWKILITSDIDAYAFGLNADNTTDDSPYLQDVINFVNGSYLAGTFGGEAGQIILPAKLIRYSGIILKKGVSLVGQGQGNTVLLLDTDGGTGIKTPAKVSQLAADAVSQSIIKGITLGVHSTLTPTVSTILLDTSGMTRCTFDDLNFVCPSNVIGCDNTGNTLAGSGGPAHWYNIWVKPFFDVSGGIGIRWGENDSSSGEQVTKQDFFGGRIGGTSGTGMHIRGGTGISFFGTTFEGLNSGSNNTILLGDSSGARITTSVNFIGHYFEQVKITYNSNTNRCMRLNGLEVNTTEVNNGTRCGRIDYDQFYHGWPRTYVSARVTTPTTINRSYNVNTGTGITKVGTGIYDVPFSITMTSINYIVSAQAESGNISCRTSTKTTTSVRLVFFDDTGAAADPTSFTVMIQDHP